MPVRTGIDGGMHPVFLAKFKNAREAGDRAGTVVEARMPGTSYVDSRRFHLVAGKRARREHFKRIREFLLTPVER